MFIAFVIFIFIVWFFICLFTPHSNQKRQSTSTNSPSKDSATICSSENATPKTIFSIKNVSVQCRMVDCESQAHPENDLPIKSSVEREQYHDNMNAMVFKGNGLFLQTNRRRKIELIAFSYNDAISKLISDGYDPNKIDIHRDCFDPPSAEQLQAMRNHNDWIPYNACFQDMSAIICRYTEDDRNADKSLMDFATQYGFVFSYFIGQKALIKRLLNTFSLDEKIALYIAYVKRDLTGSWDLNNFDKYKASAIQLMDNKQFMDSFKRNTRIYDFEEKSSRQRTLCYQIASDLVLK